MITIAQGDSLDVLNQIDWQDNQEYEVRLFLNRELTSDEMAQTEQAITGGGAVLTQPLVQSDGILFIHLKNQPSIGYGAAGLAWVAGLSFLAGAITAALVGQGTTETMPTSFLGLPTWLWIGLGGALVYWYFSSGTAMGTRATETGVPSIPTIVRKGHGKASAAYRRAINAPSRRSGEVSFGEIATDNPKRRRR